MNVFILENMIRLQEEIKSMENLIKKMDGLSCDYSISGMPNGQNRLKDVTGETATKIGDAKIIIEKKKLLLEQKIAEAEKVLDKMGNPRQRTVLRLRFLCGMSAYDIAAELDCDRRTVYRILEDAKKSYSRIKV